MTDSSNLDKLKVSRRTLLGSAAAVGGTIVAASALGPKLAASAALDNARPSSRSPAVRRSTAAGKAAAPLPVPTNWTYTTDVVVVGFGGAGGVAAITAYDAGANVIILEKVPSFAQLGFTTTLTYAGGGGNTSLDAGNCIYACNPIAAAQYYYLVGQGNTPMAVCEALAWMETEVPAWATSMGIKYSGGVGTPSAPTTTAEFTNFTGAATGFGGMTLTGGGSAYFATLASQVASRNIPVLFNTPATDLIQNPTTGEILGVQALANASEVVNVKANRGVILTTGSIEFNEAMKSDNYRPYPAHYYGWQFDTGDSVTMASKVGAAMWHMGVRDDHIIAWFPPEMGGALVSYSASVGHGIYVDKLGNRFANESLTSTVNFHMELLDYDINVPWYTRVPAFIIADSAGFATNFASGGGSTTLPTYYDPRPAFSNKMALANGWILTGPDIPTLVAAMNATTYVGIDAASNEQYFGGTHPAAKTTINMNAATLTATITAWNAMVAAGKGDTVFGRAASTMYAINTPPYYAMPLWPGGPSAFGGPVRNEKGQVCDADDNPIPRLYSAGENGSTDGFLGLGANNAQTMSFGRISGNNAAAEDPWS